MVHRDSATYFRLLELLHQGESLSAREGAKLLSVTTRTIQRCIKWAKDHENVPIAERKEGQTIYYSIPEADRKVGIRIIFTEEEALALSLAAEAAKKVLEPTPLAGPLGSAFANLLERLKTANAVSIDQEAQNRQWHFGGAPSGTIRHEVFNTIQQAIKEERKVRIDYHTAGRDEFIPNRVVAPYCIAVRAGTWLLVGWCHTHHGIREFNLVDISKAVLAEFADKTKNYFDPPQNFDPNEYFRDRFRLLGNAQVYTVRLLAEQKKARYFQRKKYHPTQLVEEKRPDGSIVVRYKVEGLEEIRSFAQSWGTGITVLDPPELTAIMRAQANELAERYNNATTISQPSHGNSPAQGSTPQNVRTHARSVEK